MYRFIQKQGFTLIELMVVIVIIGVLASLAIPRFTEASVKAKVAEAPRIIASFESAYLALVAEEGTITSTDNLVFEKPTSSKWFSYSDPASDGLFGAVANATMGDITSGTPLSTTYTSGDDDKWNFAHFCGAGFAKKIPNFNCSSAD